MELNNDNPDPIDPAAEAAKRLAKAEELARAFARRMREHFSHLGPFDLLTILAVTSLDLVAEALVMLDGNNLMSLDESMPMMMTRLSTKIDAALAAQKPKIRIARPGDLPPSARN